MENGLDVINIYFSTDKNYFSKCIIAITSMLENHKSAEKLSVHILTSDLGEEESKIAQSLAQKYNASIDFVQIDKKQFEIYTKEQNMKYLSINAFYRFFIPSVAPDECKKAVYLDCDLIVTGDISELYNQVIEEYKAGVIEDKMAKQQIKTLSLKGDKYFNSGVLLLNIEELRKTDFLRETVDYFNKNFEIIEFHDQDILNGIWDNQVKFLDERFNAQSHSFLRMKKRYKLAGVTRIYNPVIIHYTGSVKPWQINCIHKRALDWLKYQQMTIYKLSDFQVLLFKIKRFLTRIAYINYKNSKLFISLFGMKLYQG